MSWPIRCLGDVSEFIRNGASIPQSKDAGGVPITRIESISERIFNQNKCGYAGVGDSEYLEYRLRLGDILVSHINSEKHLAKCVIFEDEGFDVIHGMNLLCARPDQKKIFPRFLFHYLSSPKFLHLIPAITKKSVNQASFTVTAFKELPIPLPPLPEQKRIAAILDKADAIRRKRQRAIQLADDFLRAVFLDMFGDPVTNPKGWEVRPLSELVSKLGDGLHGTPEYDESGDYYFINGNNLDSGSIVISERVKRVGDEEFKKHKKELSKNTMLVSINGTIGKVAFYQGEKVVLGKSVCYFNVIPGRISSMYLCHLIGSHYFLRYTSGVETGSTIKNVSLKSMRELPVPLPSAELQGSFESLVKRIESKKAKLSAGHNSASALFDSLIQNTFSGRL